MKCFSSLFKWTAALAVVCSQLHATSSGDAAGESLRPASDEPDPLPEAIRGGTVAAVNGSVVYPAQIPPVFSDDNWISMGGVPGANGQVSAVVVDNSGNLYIGGEFTVVGNVVANRIAKWDGKK